MRMTTTILWLGDSRERIARSGRRGGKNDLFGRFAILLARWSRFIFGAAGRATNSITSRSFRVLRITNARGNVPAYLYAIIRSATSDDTAGTYSYGYNTTARWYLLYNII